MFQFNQVLLSKFSVIRFCFFLLLIIVSCKSAQHTVTCTQLTHFVLDFGSCRFWRCVFLLHTPLIHLTSGPTPSPTTRPKRLYPCTQSFCPQARPGLVLADFDAPRTGAPRSRHPYMQCNCFDTFPQPPTPILLCTGQQLATLTQGVSRHSPGYPCAQHRFETCRRRFLVGAAQETQHLLQNWVVAAQAVSLVWLDQPSVGSEGFCRRCQGT